MIEANRFRNCPIARSIQAWLICSQLVTRRPSGAQCLELVVGKQAAVEHPIWSNPLDLSPGYYEASFQVQ